MTNAPWRADPDLAGRFHAEYPDDLEVVVHDGEPRRTQRSPEGCWVRVTGVHGTARVPCAPRDAGPPVRSRDARWVERTVYKGTLLNQPHGLATVRQNDEVLFLHAPGLPHPLQVSQGYLAERAAWAFVPCDKCGADQGLDPPTVMAKTRFPNAPEGTVPVAFTAFCPCGGTMMLLHIEDAAPPAAGGSGAASGGKPWWRFW